MIYRRLRDWKARNPGLAALVFALAMPLAALVVLDVLGLPLFPAAILHIVGLVYAFSTW